MVKLFKRGVIMDMLIGDKNFYFNAYHETFKENRIRGYIDDDMFFACLYYDGKYYIGKDFSNDYSIKQLKKIKKTTKNFEYVIVKANERIIPKIDELEAKILALKLANV